MWRWNSYSESQLGYLFSSVLLPTLPSRMYVYCVAKMMSLPLISFTWLHLWDVPSSEAGRMNLILTNAELYNLNNKQITCRRNTLIYSLHLQIVDENNNGDMYN